MQLVLEARAIKKDAERKLSKANVEAQAIKSKAAKILKDVGKNFADVQRTAANAKKTKVSEGQDVTTANLESQALVEVQQKLNEVEQQLTILTETIAEKGQEIDNLIGTIGRKDQEIADLTNVLEEKGQEIVTLTNTIKTKEQEIKESNNTHKEEEQKLKEQHKKMVDGLNEGFKNKEQKLKSEKDTTQKNLTDLTKDYKKQEKELKISNQNLSNLTNSYKASGQATAQQKKDAKKIQELETRITDLKQNHSNELAEYQKENQSLKRQIALNETKQANDAALKHNMCELAQQELVDTQQAMKELKQLPPSDVADSVKQQSNKAPVVILKAFPTKVASPVNIVGTEASNVLREQNSSQLATPKRSVTKIDPIIVKKDTDGIDNTKLPSNTLRKSATTTRTSVDKISHGYISRKEEPRQIGGQSYPRNK
ncbi:hypothetical protein [Candidatus Tisiphia endosymbiont of Metellina segmentata]|uniref:hypothetical protein n=1 Tax=Candidatus Tisiphia endosymbiont of Metellina segmentata TaxID=3066274 RepID=UPI00313DBE3E